MPIDMHNFNIFMNSGVFGTHESYARFEGVDFFDFFS